MSLVHIIIIETVSYNKVEPLESLFYWEFYILFWKLTNVKK